MAMPFIKLDGKTTCCNAYATLGKNNFTCNVCHTNVLPVQPGLKPKKRIVKMNGHTKREDLSTYLQYCGLNVTKRTKRYIVHEGWDDQHRIYIPIRGPVWVGPTLREADTKYSTATIKRYADAYRRGPIKSGKRNMATGKFAKPTIVDLVHPAPQKPKPRPRRRKKVMNTKTVPLKKTQPKIPDTLRSIPNGNFRSKSDPSIWYSVTIHRTNGIKCNCPAFAEKGACSHARTILAERADIRMQHERTKIGKEAW